MPTHAIGDDEQLQLRIDEEIVLVVIALLALAGAILWSKRGGIDAEAGNSSGNPSSTPEEEKEPVRA